MKLNKIFSTIALAAAVFGLAACSDTDAKYTIVEDPDAPELVSVTPTDDAPLLFGQKTITLTFNKNVFFATKNAGQITLNGTPVSNALVLGSSPSLTITATPDFNKKQTLIIPAGLVMNSRGVPNDKDIVVTWELQDLPSNTATEMTKKLGWGWNLGNHFDTSNMEWGYWDGVESADIAPFAALASAGAKTVRIPTTWTNHMDENGVISADYLNEVAVVVDKAIAAGLNVVLNTHHDSFEDALGDAADDEEKAAEIEALISSLWNQVATYFKDRSDKLIFETFNEVHAGDDWSTGSEAQFKMLNEWNQTAVNVIRATGGNNATRWIGISGYAANIDLTIANLEMPKVSEWNEEEGTWEPTDEVDDHIMVGVHCYDPYGFCLQPIGNGGNEIYNSWGHNANPKTSVANTNEEYVIAQLFKLRTAYIEKGIPCYLGEYGCVLHPSDVGQAFRQYYLEFFCRCAYLAGIPMFVWDNNVTTPGNEASGYVDHDSGAFVADGATIVPMMINACTNTDDDNYWFDTIWNKSPEQPADPEE